MPGIGFIDQKPSSFILAMARSVAALRSPGGHWLGSRRVGNRSHRIIEERTLVLSAG